MTSTVTPWSAQACQMASGSRDRPGSVTTVPPSVSWPSDIMWPVPCISGPAGSSTGEALAVAARWSRCRSMVASSSSGTGKVVLISRTRVSCCHITPLGAPVVPPV